MVRHTSLMVVLAASLDLVYLRPAQEAPVEAESLFGAARRMAMR